jgi:HAD superfamily hydrolase (TIGR01450 family)
VEQLGLIAQVVRIAPTDLTDPPAQTAPTDPPAQTAPTDLTDLIAQVVRIPVAQVVLPRIVRSGLIAQVVRIAPTDLTDLPAQTAPTDLTDLIAQVVLPRIVRSGLIVQFVRIAPTDLTDLPAQTAPTDLTDLIAQVVRIPVAQVVLPRIVRSGLIVQFVRIAPTDLTDLIAQVVLPRIVRSGLIVQVVPIRSVQISSARTIRGEALEVLASKYDSLLLDLDGVVYQGSEAIVNAVESINRAANLGIQVGYLTNNSSRRAETIAEQLIGFGIQATAEQIVGSASAGVMLLAKKIPLGAKVLVVGGDGLKHAVQEQGFQVVDHASLSPAAVIQGFSPDVSWRELAQASFAIQGGAIWIATNQDWTVPVEQGIAPGNGTLVGAVHTAVGILPEIAGKPFKPIFDQALLQLGIKNPLMVGDRLDTDIRGANGSGMDSAVVMTGIVTRKELLAAGKEDRPKFILQDLTGLFDSYQQPKTTKRGAKSGDSTVELLGDRVVIVSGNPESLDTLKAACHVIWTSGRPIYALNVDASIYS